MNRSDVAHQAALLDQVSCQHGHEEGAEAIRLTRQALSAHPNLQQWHSKPQVCGVSLGVTRVGCVEGKGGGGGAGGAGGVVGEHEGHTLISSDDTPKPQLYVQHSRWQASAQHCSHACGSKP